MSDHYFSNKPTVEHDLRTIRVALRGQEFVFWTDAGVFSKAGIDFGSELLIESMEIPSDATVLDVGCGYGPIGLAAAKLAAAGQVTMLDVNERAVELARKNATSNGIANVEILVSDRYEHVQGRRFDVILTNPPIRAGKLVVHSIFDGAVEHLTERGELWVVIQKKQGAPSAKKRLEELFDSVEDVARDAGFRIFRCSQPLPKP
ncbi:class I SAM-dependent methyltransferase [Tumebacillus permanentifrigoris]|uniref:16S rRNA (Guanine1207-N2)-methyltransferase n=1 Tax=Tumebacillus permanentifrigoris TaxID=378543 RepID=A0A316D385_9BACL|nr:class I SAM-dependent methyltransferase [Tumebacillus permanentifrigoris]PWK05666.1 16S rRNA (guanine1207-N2)-methyltransferase [Tumebacillus permanentifrigoris]